VSRSGNTVVKAVVGKRYIPLLAAVLAQLLVILLWPSKPLSSGSALAVGAAGGPSSFGAGPEVTGDAAGAAGGTAPGAGVGSGGGGGGPRAAAVVGRGGAKPGDTSHCVAGRQFDPALDFYAPPCIPAWGGSNGGVTYRGVSSDAIKVIEYHPHQNEAIDTVRKSIGTYETAEQRDAFRTASEKVINARYELYGRKLDIIEVEGTCSTIPADVACLRNEFRGIVIDQKPFAFITGSPCSACVDELAQQHVLVVGSNYYPDKFLRSMAPYYWTSVQSGSRIAQLFAQFWCANLTHQPARYAVNRPGNTNGQMRKLGVVTSNDPQSQVVVDDLKTELAACGDSVAAEYYYSSDPTTAAQQAQAGLDKMRSAGVTSLAFLADAAAPGFFFAVEQSNNYYPEALVSGSGRQDTDAIGQGYSNDRGQACPAGHPCPFDPAFGVGPVHEAPADQGPATNVWRAAGNQGPVPSDADETNWEHYRLLATLLQAGGPALTPVSVEQGIRTYPPRGDENHTLLGFDRGSYAWQMDTQIIYWDRNAMSAANRKQGAYVRVGPRVSLGGFRTGGLGTLPPR
jgi:hypothetical protein